MNRLGFCRVQQGLWPKPIYSLVVQKNVTTFSELVTCQLFGSTWTEKSRHSRISNYIHRYVFFCLFTSNLTPSGTCATFVWWCCFYNHLLSCAAPPNLWVHSISITCLNNMMGQKATLVSTIHGFLWAPSMVFFSFFFFSGRIIIIQPFLIRWHKSKLTLKRIGCHLKLLNSRVMDKEITFNLKRVKILTCRSDRYFSIP